MLCYTFPVSTKEEMGKNEDVVAQQQASKVQNTRGNPRNTARRQVGAFWVVFWLSLALISMTLWLLRLLNLLEP